MVMNLKKVTAKNKRESNPSFIIMLFQIQVQDQREQEVQLRVHKLSQLCGERDNRRILGLNIA
jgi:hypothetical protein